MICFPAHALRATPGVRAVPTAALKPRTLAAFLCATGVVVAGAVTLVSGLGGVLAFDDGNPAAFFRADRARMQGAAPTRATAAPSAPVSTAAARPSADPAAKLRNAAKKLAASKRNAHPIANLDKVRLAATHAAIQSDASANLTTGSGSQSVCVRLCDGFHYPVGDASDAGNVAAHEATCAATCPGAPTRLFVLPAGTDDINRAYSPRNGQSYAALPVAFRHVEKRDNTCSCRSASSAQQSLASMFRDFTLRQGDAVMTREGVRVFRGAKKLPYQPRDFSVLNGSGLGSSERRILQAIEKASLPNLDTWREKPRSPTISTATPVPSLGPFRVRGRSTAQASQVEANINALP